MPIPFNNTSEYISTTYMKGLMNPENETSAEPKPPEAPKFHSIFDTNKNEIIESSDAKVASHLKENCKITESSNEYIKTNLSSQVENFVKNAMDALGKFSFKYTAGTYNPFNIMKIESEGTIKQAEDQLASQTQKINEHMQNAYNQATILAQQEFEKAEAAKLAIEVDNLFQNKAKVNSSQDSQQDSQVIVQNLKDSIIGLADKKDITQRHKTVMTSISQDNIIEVLEGYQNNGGRSLLKDIGDESDGGEYVKNGKDPTKFRYIPYNRIDEALHICRKLIARAKSAGIPEDQVQGFATQLNAVYQVQKTAWNYDFSQFDTIVNGITSLIKTYEATSAETKAMVSGMDVSAQNSMAYATARGEYNTAMAGYTDFRDGEGFISDGINWGKEGLNDLFDMEYFTSREITETKLEQYGNDLDRLDAAKNGTLKDENGNPISFEQEFQRIYGIKPDAVAIANFNNVRDEYQQYSGISNRASLASKLSKDCLSSSQTRSFINVGTEQVSHIQATEADFNKNYQSVINYFGSEESFNATCANLGINLPLSGTPEEKLRTLSTIMKNQSQIYSSAAENFSGGLSAKEMSEKYDASYTAAFGTKNDTARIVSDYTNSQSSALAIAKGIVLTAISVFTGGAVAAGILTTATMMGMDELEMMTNKKQETSEEINQMVVDAVLAGLSVAAGKYIVQGIKWTDKRFVANLVPKNSVVRNGVKNVARDFVSEEVKTTTSGVIKKGEFTVGTGGKEATSAGINLLANGNKYIKYGLKLIQNNV